MMILKFMENQTYVGFIPLAERRSINLNDSTFDKCVGSNELVIGGVVYLNV